MLSGVPAFFQNISSFPMAREIHPGQAYAGVVRAQDDVMIIVSGRLQIPLDEGSGLVPGQKVTFQLTTTPAGAQITISPELAAGAAPNSPTPASALTPILEALGKLELAQRIHGAIPRHAPTTDAALRPLLTVLLAEQGLGADLDQLARTLTAVAPQLSPGQGAALAIAQWLGLVPASDSAAWRTLLLRSREEQSVAARIAASIKSESSSGDLGALKKSAAALASRLLSDPEFMHALKEDAKLDPFKALAQRLQDRSTGADLQNLRSLDQSYQFLEIPVAESQGFRRAQLHTFEEKSGPARPPGSSVHTTVLDLETTHLGALWVSLQSAGPQCTCHFRVEDPAVAELLSKEAAALESSLADAGFGRAAVSATLWNGNREDALIAMLAPYQKLDLEV